MEFPLNYQSNKFDCGPSCIRSVLDYMDISYTYSTIRKKCKVVDNKGTSVENISKTLNYYGLNSEAYYMTEKQLRKISLPVILLLRKNHYVILYKIANSRFYLCDSAEGLIQYSKTELNNNWLNKKENGVVITVNEVFNQAVQ